MEEVKKEEKTNSVGNVKLLRQQVLALLRKLDGGEIDLVTFNSHLRDMGKKERKKERSIDEMIAEKKKESKNYLREWRD